MTEEVILTKQQQEVLVYIATNFTKQEVDALVEIAKDRMYAKAKKIVQEEERKHLIEQLEALYDEPYIDDQLIGQLIEHIKMGETSLVIPTTKIISEPLKTLDMLKKVKGLNVEIIPVPFVEPVKFTW